MYELHLPPQYSPTLTPGLVAIANDEQVTDVVSASLGVMHHQMMSGSFMRKLHVLGHSSVKPDAVAFNFYIEFNASAPRGALTVLYENLVEIDNVLVTWMKRQRVTGARGDRAYAYRVAQSEDDGCVLRATHLMVDGEQTDFIDEDEFTSAIRASTPITGRVALGAQVLLGTMVFYNNWRATYGIHATVDELTADVSTMIQHLLPLLPPELDARIVIDHSELGKGIKVPLIVKSALSQPIPGPQAGDPLGYLAGAVTTITSAPTQPVQQPLPGVPTAAPAYKPFRGLYAKALAKGLIKNDRVCVTIKTAAPLSYAIDPSSTKHLSWQTKTVRAALKAELSK